MKNFTVILAALLLLCLSAFAQAPDTLWTRVYGGISTDYGYCVRQTADGGFIVAGYAVPMGAPDFWLVKTDADGDTLWTRFIGGPAPETAFSIEQTTDGGYIVGGYTFSYGAGAMDFYLVKTNSTGDTMWTRTYGGYNIDYGHEVKQTADGGYIFGGYTASFAVGADDFYLVKTDSLGNSVWTQTYGGVGIDEGFSVKQTTDGGYIFAGVTQSYGAGGNDVYLVRADANGDTLWTRTYGGVGDDKGNSVQQTSDGGFIIAGSTSSYGGGSNDYYIIKTDASGDTLWTRTFGGIGVNDFAQDVQQTSDGGYIVAGYTDSYGLNSIYYYLVKLDASGDSTWTFICGGDANDEAFSVRQTTDGGYIVAGQTMSYGAGNMDYYLVRLAAELPPFSLTLTPHNPPIQVPAGGGSFNFGAEISNNGLENIPVIVWVNATLPGGANFHITTRMLMAPAGATFVRDPLVQFIPAGAAAGNYMYNCYAGNFATWEVLDSDSFPFEKLAGDAVPNHNQGWECYGWLDEETALTSTPAQFILGGASPNPFNPTTTIGFTLPEAGKVMLSVFDLAGREVARLVEGEMFAGHHSVVFDGTGLASGVYFCKLTADGVSDVRKMILVK